MEQISTKYQNVLGAYNTYIRSVEYYTFQEKTMQNSYDNSFSSDEILDGARRSLIQAFEIFIEVLWKYLKWLLEEVCTVTLEIATPRSIIAKACEVRILSEADTRILIDLINLRNQTSPIYKEELAVLIAHKLCSMQAHITAIVTHCNDKDFV
jgi:hypothetical protein